MCGPAAAPGHTVVIRARYSAGGATQVSPAVHGWESRHFISPSAVGTPRNHRHVRPVTAPGYRCFYPRPMSHTYSSLLVHCVFSTKDRRDLIREPRLLWRYLAGIAQAKQIPLAAAGGTANHVHLLLDLPPTMQLAHAVQQLSGASSRSSSPCCGSTESNTTIDSYWGEGVSCLRHSGFLLIR